MRERTIHLAASSRPIGQSSDPSPLNCSQIWDEYRDNQRELSQLREEIELRCQEVEREPEKARALSDQWEQILHQLFLVQEELERQLNAQRGHARQINELRSELSRESRLRLNAELRADALLRSFSWRITAPLRYLLTPLLGRPFTGKPIHECRVGEKS